MIASSPIIFNGNSNEVNEYDSVQISYFKLNGIVLSHTTTRCDISQTILEKEMDGSVVVEYVVSNQQNDGELENIKHVTDFLKIIESVSEKLVLNIDKYGTVDKIINKAELLAKWNQLKKELPQNPVFNAMPSSNQELIINQGDMEYDLRYPYHEGIKNSLIFYNLIYPFYGANLSESDKYGSFKSQRNSSIVQHVKVNLNNDVIFQESKNGGKEIRVHSSFDKNMDLGSLERELKKNFKHFPGNIQSYSYSMSHTYELEEGSNKIIKSKLVLSEKIDEAFEVNIQYELNLKRDE